MMYQGKANEFFELKTITSNFNQAISTCKQKTSLSILWNIDTPATLVIDEVTFTLESNELLFLTEFHHVEVKEAASLRLLKFNRDFYCLEEHDSDVGCKGVLFFGASNVPKICIEEKDLSQFEMAWNTLLFEINNPNAMQSEMLQVLLKRLLILCTRKYTQENYSASKTNKQLEVIRNFNFLVEKHFKEEHSVAFYANELYLAPKTLTGYFSNNHQKTPLQIIQNRIMVEARRQLLYTSKSIKEIAVLLGFEDVQSFSRFFKNKQQKPPSLYRKSNLTEKLPTLQEI